jgi:hypothetical protein
MITSHRILIWGSRNIQSDREQYSAIKMPRAIAADSGLGKPLLAPEPAPQNACLDVYQDDTGASTQFTNRQHAYLMHDSSRNALSSRYIARWMTWCPVRPSWTEKGLASNVLAFQDFPGLALREAHRSRGLHSM